MPSVHSFLTPLRSLAGVPIFDLDYDAILATMYAVSISAEGDCYLCVPPDPSIEAAALGASESAAPDAGEASLSGTASAQVLHTFTLDSGASRTFFHDCTTLSTLSRPVAISQADPSWGPVLAHSSTVLPCPAVPSGSLSSLHLPSFSTNLVSGADLQDAWVDQFTPGGQWVTHCSCTRTGWHLATFTRQPGSSLYTLTTVPPQVAESGQVAASSQVFAAASRSGPESDPCSCRLLSHQTLLWHHRLGHPSLSRLQGMASSVLVTSLPRPLPPLPLGPAPTCVPCVEGRQRGAPHSSEFPPTCGAPPASVDRVTSATFCWSLTTTRVTAQSSPCAARVRSLRGGEFSSDLLRAFCCAEGIRQTFTLPASPQQNGIAERHIGMYAAHQINLQPRVSLPETTPTLRWTGKVGDASAFRVWGSRAFVRDTSADKLSSRAVPCVFLGFPPDAPGWQFYHPTSRRVLSSQDVTFDESVPYYRLFPYRTAPLPPPPLFLARGPPPVDPLPPQGPARSGVSQVDAVKPVEVAVDSSAARGVEPAGAGFGGAEPERAKPGGAEFGGAESGGAEPGVAESGGAEPEGAEPTRVESGGAAPGSPSGASSQREPLSPQQLHEWFARRWSRAAGASGATRAGGPATAGAAGGSGATGPGGAHTGGTGAAEPGGAAGAGAAQGAGAGGTTGPGATGGAGPSAAGAAGASSGPGGAGAGGARAGGAAGAGAPWGAVVGATGAAGGAGGVGGAIGVGADAGGASVVPAGSGGLRGRGRTSFRSLSSGPTGGLTERREPETRPALPVCDARTGRRGSRQRPPPVPGTHQMALRPSTAPQRVPLRLLLSPLFLHLLTLIAELVDFAAHCRLYYAASLVAESASASVSPPSVGDIPTRRSYAEAIEDPYSSQWQTAMDAEMASWMSTGTYVDEVPPSGANIVDGMWIFRVKRPPGSLLVFKARYVARGFSQRQGFYYFHTFSPTLKMTTLRVLLHVATQRDYELHSLDFSTAFLQGSLHEEI
ncbi:unnamed protein product [Closterium sp. NIES-53]